MSNHKSIVPATGETTVVAGQPDTSYHHCCCCLHVSSTPITAVPNWATLLLGYLGWIGFGFLFGFHWLAVAFCAARSRADRLWAVINFACVLIALGMVAGGGAYVRGVPLPCQNGTEMSHHCLFHVQTITYQGVYIFHFVGLAWLATAWVCDGLQLWHWSYFHSPVPQNDNRLALKLFYSQIPLAGPWYSVVLALITILVSCTWTVFITNWTTDTSGLEERGLMGLTELAGFLFVEILSCAAVTAIILNLMRCCKIKSTNNDSSTTDKSGV